MWTGWSACHHQSADFIINHENHLQEHKEATALLKQPEQEEYRLCTWDTALEEHGRAPTAQTSCCAIPLTAF